LAGTVCRGGASSHDVTGHDDCDLLGCSGLVGARILYGLCERQAGGGGLLRLGGDIQVLYLGRQRRTPRACDRHGLYGVSCRVLAERISPALPSLYLGTQYSFYVAKVAGVQWLKKKQR
jgi:hypothetical protein